MKVFKTERENGTMRLQLKTEGPSRTEQSHKNEVNINNIIAKYRKTGFVERENRTPMFGDFSSADAFQDAKLRVMNVRNEFNSLPSQIRNKFNNSPTELLEFINNPENASDCVQMGLIEKMMPDIENFGEVAKNTPQNAEEATEELPFEDEKSNA